MKRKRQSGEPFIWLSGGALAVCLLMVGGLIGLVLVQGLGFFWPRDLLLVTLADGKSLLGPVTAREQVPPVLLHPGSPPQYRTQIRKGNRSPADPIEFVWVDDCDIQRQEWPAEAVLIERREWGPCIGYLRKFESAGQTLATGADDTLRELELRLPEAHALFERIHALQKKEIGAINAAQQELQRNLRARERSGKDTGPEADQLREELKEWQARYKAEEIKLFALRASQQGQVTLATAGGGELVIQLSDVVRASAPNRMGVPGKLGLYASRVFEFVFAEPRECNTEGGVFPALFGTVLMVLLMSLMVTPLGVIAAVYLREYARQGALARFVRIAVNNLAGVPSIVYGVFGVGFFIYFIGGTLDQLFFFDALPEPTFGTGGILWASLTLALLTLPVVIVATEEGLAAVPGGLREAALALGATKWETVWRVVVPAASPSILTGMILALARAAGEVAPLMLTGVVKIAPTLPLDGTWPFLHLDRKFMHLGFHIYDVGFQSPNVDAARPMVFATTLLLLAMVLALNVGAILLRNRLRARLSMAAV